LEYNVHHQPNKRKHLFVKVKSPITTIPFVKTHEFNYAKLLPKNLQDYTYLLYILIVIFIVTAVSNGANITDGLDGLATGVSAIIGISLGIFAYVSGNIKFAEYLNIMYIPNLGELSIFIAAFSADLSWNVCIDALKATTRSVGNLLFIIYTAYIFAYAISVAGVGEDVTSWVVGLKLSRLEFFLALFVLYTVLGCLVESFGMIVITVPLLYPVLLSYGIDPVWFGIILVVFIELGQISPPIGINLFVIQSISRGKFSDVVLGTVPFHILMFVLLILLVIFPEIALWLPAHMLGTK
jgi:TRAP-type C4-dicarboxylate transport system permease large subunit